ncbi:MAG: ATP citrate synthase [Thermoplasmata archaeon]|nr:MAG: ATP citrate synthase [Thermoplasmata archaeon]
MSDDMRLFTRETRAIVWGLQANAIQRMLDFDYLVGRETPSVACVVNPNREGYHKVFWGSKETFVPMYRSLKEAAEKHPEADVLVNFASFRTAFSVTMEALEIPTIHTIAVIAEGIPERDSRRMAHEARERGKWIIGPATVGGIAAGAFRIGNTAGTIENIIQSKLYRPGSVGLVTKSGGLLNEMMNIISRNSDGIYQGIAIGGDRYPGSTLLDHLLRYEKIDEVKFMVALGEVGGREEYRVVEALKDGRITKPLIFWVLGTCAPIFPTEVQFGHAGALAGSAEETAQAKLEALKEAGAIVPETFADLDMVIQETYKRLREEGVIGPEAEATYRPVPMDFKKALQKSIIRYPTHITTTISDDRGEEVVYAGYPLSEILQSGASIGDVISLLWFKRRFPDWATKFIELVLMTVADHGPAVSGAHNAIVTARAGKDLMSSVASGILTIGPRFGGAISDAAYYFHNALLSGLSPKEFVDDMKAKGILIPGIGHRVKSLENPDKRVEILVKYARENFPSTEHLDYALMVQGITTKKKINLILNVDGCVGVLFMDLFKSLGMSEEEIEELLRTEVLNAFFLLGRSIGIIGHVLDQKRLKERLYRHPWEDILYMVERPEE